MKRRLFTRLLATYLVVILASTLIFGLLFSQLLKERMLNDKQEELINKGTQLSYLAGQYLQGQTTEKELANQLSALDDFLDARVWVIDKNGQVMALSQGAGRGPGTGAGMGRGMGRGLMIGRMRQGMTLTPEETSKVLGGDTVTRQGTHPRFDEPMLSVAVPVFGGQGAESPEVIGAVFLNTSVLGTTEAIDNSYPLLLTAFLAAALIATVLALYLSRTISRPLREMNNAALSMAQGDYARRVEVTTRDEVNELADSLNYLAGKLEQSVTALKEEKGKVEMMLMSLSEGILAVDRDGRILRLNPAAVKILSLKEDQLEQQPVSALPCPELTGLFNGVLGSGESGFGDISLGDQTIRAYVSPITDGSVILGAIGVLQDISQSERLENMRRDFVANVSHELRTPLTVIRGFIEALLDEVVESPEQQERYYRLIRQETVRLERLISDLLDLSRLESGRVELELEEVDIRPLAEGVLERFRPTAEEKRIALELVSPDSPSPVLGDGDRLEQLLIIFVDNALRYTPPGGQVTVSLKPDDEGTRVTIADTGTGIPPEDLPYIWDRFYKVDKSHTPSAGGTGLGLFIARQIIDLHRGEVKVKSEPGKGSTFEISLKR